MKPSDVLKMNRNEIRRIVEFNDACNPRIFGSTVRGEDNEDSDLDILVDPIHGKTTLMSLVGIEFELSSLLGVKVDVQTPLALSERFRNNVLKEAMPV
ncbi:MAG: nucleotidyltransferase family protein [Methylophilaceae bacterium]